MFSLSICLVTSVLMISTHSPQRLQFWPSISTLCTKRGRKKAEMNTPAQQSVYSSGWLPSNNSLLPYAFPHGSNSKKEKKIRSVNKCRRMWPRSCLTFRWNRILPRVLRSPQICHLCGRTNDSFCAWSFSLETGVRRRFGVVIEMQMHRPWDVVFFFMSFQ